MDRPLEAQALALHARRQVCAARPALHAHQLLALEREIALCTAAATLHGYQRASGGAFELTRAAWLDRVAGRLRLACALGDAPGAQAALAACQRALASTGPGDWVAALTPAPTPGAEGMGLLVRCLHNLTLAQGGAPPMADAEGEARAAWRELCAADPALAWAAWQSPQALRGLALRLPWRGAAARAVRGWLHGLAMPEPAVAPALPDAEVELAAWRPRWQQTWRTDPPDAGPPWADFSAEQATAPWRALAAGAEPTVARIAAQMLALAAGADCAPEVERRLVLSPLPAALAAAPLLAQAQALEARQAAWPQPLLAGHAAALRGGLAQAHTPVEVEQVAAHADACLAVEADAQRLFWAAAAAPVHAALRCALGAPGAAADLRRAVRLSHRLFGMGPRALHALPAQAALWHDNLLPALDAQDQGAWQGECGADLLPLLRAWRALAPAAAVSLSRLLDQTALAEPQARPAAPPRRLQLWDTPVLLADWPAALGGALRPAIPGWHGIQAQSRSRTPL